MICAAALQSAAAFACTSWVLHPSVTKSHRMIVQKCRDSSSKVLDADMRTTENGLRWMRIGAGGGAAFSMNACGVVATSNNGDILTKPEKPLPKIGGWVLARVAAGSSTAREAVTRETPKRRMIAVRLGKGRSAGYLPERMSPRSASATTMYPLPPFCCPSRMLQTLSHKTRAKSNQYIPVFTRDS